MGDTIFNVVIVALVGVPVFLGVGLVAMLIAYVVSEWFDSR